MTKRLTVTQRQAEVFLRAAEAQRAIIEVELGDQTIRFIPACYAGEKRQPEPKKSMVTFDARHSADPKALHSKGDDTPRKGRLVLISAES